MKPKRMANSPTRPLTPLTLLAALVASLIVVATARADGLPVLGIDVGSTGVAPPGGSIRYVTIPAGPSTVVARVSTDSGAILASRTLPGSLTIPAVAYDGSAAGLSGDGSTLALISPRDAFPRAVTPLVVLNANSLGVRRRVNIRGDFSFDAISPDGATLYLIRYLSPQDPTRYEVRAYDLARAELVPDPVIDSSEPDEAMRGIPVSRAASTDGRFAYTLYDRPGKEPFVHVLDTEARRAHCVDLPLLAGHPTSAMRLRLDPNGGPLVITDSGRPVAQIDAGSYAVSDARTSAGSASTVSRPTLSTLQVAGLVTVAALAAALLFALARRRRRRQGGGEDVAHTPG